MSRYISVLICVCILNLTLFACRGSESGEVTLPQTVDLGGKAIPGDNDDVSDTVPVEQFSISSAYKTTPEDVLREIKFYPIGGPGISCAGYEDDVLPVYENVTFIDLPDRNLELEESMHGVSCGWQSNELVRITIEFPDGSSVSQEVYAVEHLTTAQRESISGDLVSYYGVGFTHETNWNDLPGHYTFTLEGNSGEVQHTFHITRPAGPRLYYYYYDKSIFLYNFEPNECIRLLAYEDSGSHGVLVAWQEYQVDSSGQLVVQIESGYTYVAIGDISGDVYEFGGRFSDITSFNIEANTGSDRLNVREGPGYEYSVIAQVTSGTLMKVIGSGRGFDEDRWWPVCLNDGTEGWVIDTWVKHVE